MLTNSFTDEHKADTMALTAGTGRSSGNGHSNHGGHGGHSNGGGGSVTERLIRLEAHVEQNTGVLKHISTVVARVDDEQDRMFAAIVGVEKAIARLETGLDKTQEITGNFRLETVQKELARKEAAEARRSNALLTLGIGVTLAALTGIVALIWRVLGGV